MSDLRELLTNIKGAVINETIINNIMHTVSQQQEELLEKVEQAYYESTTNERFLEKFEILKQDLTKKGEK